MAMGVLATGSAVGGAALSLVARRLLDLIGFAWTMRSLALIFAVMLGVACLVGVRTCVLLTFSSSSLSLLRGIGLPLDYLPSQSSKIHSFQSMWRLLVSPALGSICPSLIWKSMLYDSD